MSGSKSSAPSASARGPVVLAAGGTGGHLFPAEALARQLLARGMAGAPQDGLAPVLVTDHRSRAFGEGLPEVPVHRVRSATLLPGLAGKVRMLVEIAMGTRDACRLLRQLRPAVVVGFGGYPSLPTLLAARLLGVPLVLHEQNAVLGRANRMLAGAARAIAVSFMAVEKLPPWCQERLVFTGNPVRAAFDGVRAIAYRPPAGQGPLHLLVLGGSQGARVFSEVVPAALALLPATTRARLHLTQQCRREDLAQAQAALAGLELAALEVSSFFHDIPRRLEAAHLVLCRAGASSIAELTLAGRPAVLVPYPYATDDHQTANAAALDRAGAGWLIPQKQLTAEALAAHLSALFAEPERLAQAATAARDWGRPDAAERLAEAVLAAAGASAAAGSNDSAPGGDDTREVAG